MHGIDPHMGKITPAGTRVSYPFPAMTLQWRTLYQRHPRALRLLLIGLLLVLALISVGAKAHAAPLRTMRGSSSSPYQTYMAEASQRFAIPAVWIRAVIAVESAGNALALSPKGAMGLMQLMPQTWSELRAKFHLGFDPFDPRDNILAGAGYLRALYDRFGATGFLAAYNAGPGRYDEYLAGRRPLSGETRHYLSTLARLLPDLPIRAIADQSGGEIAWRSAGLFVGQSSTPAQPNGVTSDHNAQSQSTARHFALTPQANGLFVAISSTAPR